MSSEIRGVVLNNTNIKFAGRTPEDDRMAKLMGKDLADIQGLQTGVFLGKVGNGMTFKLYVDDALVGDKQAMNDTDWQALVHTMKRHYRPLGAGVNNPMEPPTPPSPPDDERELI